MFSFFLGFLLPHLRFFQFATEYVSYIFGLSPVTYLFFPICDIIKLFLSWILFCHIFVFSNLRHNQAFPFSDFVLSHIRFYPICDIIKLFLFRILFCRIFVFPICDIIKHFASSYLLFHFQGYQISHEATGLTS